MGKFFARDSQEFKMVQLYSFRSWSDIVGGVNYYRRNFPQILISDTKLKHKIKTKTLCIWGIKDPYLVPQIAYDHPLYHEDCQVELVDGQGHWVPYSDFEKVNFFMEKFLGN